MAVARTFDQPHPVFALVRTDVAAHLTAFLAAGDYHHHIGLNTWESAGGTTPPPGHTGLYHTAFIYPDRKSLAQTLKRVLAAGVAGQGCPRHRGEQVTTVEVPPDRPLRIEFGRVAPVPPLDRGGLFELRHAALHRDRFADT